MNMSADPQALPLICWEFERRCQRLMCGISIAAESSRFEVATTPLWNPASESVEHFDTPVGALHRHAEIVRELRHAGWTLSAYTETR